MKKLTLLIAIVFVKFTFAQFWLNDTLDIQFVDISSTGTNLNLSDDAEANLTTPFTVYIKDQSTNYIRVGNNGAILFGDTTGNIPAANADLFTSPLMIAPFWDDFDSEMGGVYYQEFNHYFNGILIASEFIIQWDRVHYNGSTNTDTASFQVVFHRYSKAIDFVYHDVDMDGTTYDYGASATIGISTADSIYLYSKDSASLVNVTSISFEQKRTYVPDDNFEAYLESNGMGDGAGGNNYVFTENIKDVTYLDISNQNIVDFTGLKDFASLTHLNVSTNPNTSIFDVSHNTKLTYLSCHDMNLTSLNVSNLPDLDYLSCYQNNLDTLILGQKDSLTYLYAYSNDLSGIDVSSCPNLKHIVIGRNNISSIDLSNNNLIEELNISITPISEIDLSNLSNLNRFTSYYMTSLKTINFDNNPLLEKIDLRNNDSLQTINLQNAANNLLAGTYDYYGTETSRFRAGNCPNLTCIYVDNATDATAGINDYDSWEIDSTAHFVETDQECNVYTMTYVPDDNFEAYLEANGMGNGVANDDYVLTANISNVTGLNVSNKGITDFTGLENFTALTDLNTSENHNTIHFDVSNNTNLISLYCYNMDIDTLNVSNLQNLKKLYCFGNSLTSLDCSNSPDLEELSCSYNNINSLNIDNCNSLRTITVYGNNLSNIDVSDKTSLEFLNVGSNSFVNIDLSNNINLQRFYCNNNNFVNINLDNNNNLEIVDFSNNYSLEELHIQNGANGLLSGMYNSNGYSVNRFTATNCNNLTCIYVDNASDANAGINDYQDWLIDPGTHFVETEAECQALSVKSVMNENVNVYPNPAKNYIRIDAKNIVQVKLIDIAGKTIIVKDNNCSVVDVSNLQQGIYTLIIKTNKQIVTKQINIIK